MFWARLTRPANSRWWISVFVLMANTLCGSVSLLLRANSRSRNTLSAYSKHVIIHIGWTDVCDERVNIHDLSASCLIPVFGFSLFSPRSLNRRECSALGASVIADDRESELSIFCRIVAAISVARVKHAPLLCCLKPSFSVCCCWLTDYLKLVWSQSPVREGGLHAHSLAIFCAVVVVCSRCFARHGSSRRQRHSVVKSFFDTRAELSRRFVCCQRPPTNILCRNIWYSTTHCIICG